MGRSAEQATRSGATLGGGEAGHEAGEESGIDSAGGVGRVQDGRFPGRHRTRTRAGRGAAAGY